MCLLLWAQNDPLGSTCPKFNLTIHEAEAIWNALCLGSAVSFALLALC
jgi:hypothetical protein